MEDLNVNSITDPQFDALAQKVRLGIKRKQVALGRQRLLPLCKSNNVAFVWASNGLSHHALGKLKVQCKKFKVPLLLFSSSEYIGQTTGEPSTKVYIIKKSFSGIKQIQAEFRENFQS